MLYKTICVNSDRISVKETKLANNEFHFLKITADILKGNFFPKLKVERKIQERASNRLYFAYTNTKGHTKKNSFDIFIYEIALTKVKCKNFAYI